MKVKNKITVAIIILIILIVLVKPLYDSHRLKNDGVFTVGRLKLISDGVKGSISYKFDYEMFNVVYHYSFSGRLPIAALLDSAIFLKVLPSKPKICRAILDVEVPNCLLRSNIVLNVLPSNNFCDTLNRK